MSNTYEKIALSKQDLRHVYSQILGGTTAKLDLHLPTTGNDPLKNEVSLVLDEFLLGAFELAKSALIVDGVDLAKSKNSSDILALKPKEIVEPFDFSIDNQLRDVLLQVEQETVALTTLRRELPQNARKVYQDLVAKTDGEVSEMLAEWEKQPEDTDVQEEVLPVLKQTSEDYEAHILMLQYLKRDLPERRAELDNYEQTIKFLRDAYEQQEQESQKL